jgi:hypothetical protein
MLPSSTNWQKFYSLLLQMNSRTNRRARGYCVHLRNYNPVQLSRWASRFKPALNIILAHVHNLCMHVHKILLP